MRRWVLVASVFALCGCNLLKKGDAADAAPEAAAPVDAGPGDAAPAAEEDAGPAPELDAGATPTTQKKPAAAVPFAAGEAWGGTYDCGGSNPVTLKITKVNGNSIGAIFDFKNKKKAGSFLMSGNYDPASKRLVLNAGNWVVEPKGMVTVGLDGTVSDGRVYSGKVVGPGCNTFTVKK